MAVIIACGDSVPQTVGGEVTNEVKAAAPSRPKETIVFGDLNWPSAQLQDRIAQYIIEHGYGYPTDVKFGTSETLFNGLQRGDIHVIMEIWLPGQRDAWRKALSENKVLSLGESLGSDWESSFVIPAYLQEQYPELDSITDLTEQKYKDLFKTVETDGKARLVSCVIGWSCESVNAIQVEGYGLSDHVMIVNPSDGATLNADLRNAYERREPWLGYQWGTSETAMRLDLVQLKEPPYSDQCWATTKACAYKNSTILIAANFGLPDSAPDIAEMLRKWDLNVSIYKSVIRWREQNPHIDTATTAMWWLDSNHDIWSGWVTEEAADAIKAALAASEEAVGWPDE